MTDVSQLILFDRSRITTDWKCPRARWWQYEYLGQGIVPHTVDLPLFLGICHHDALAVLAEEHRKGTNINEIARALADKVYEQVFSGLYNPEYPSDALTFAKEQATLMQGLIYAFAKWRWPQLTAIYPKVIFTESEMHYDITAPNGAVMRFMAKPDLVLANEDETDVVYFEAKTTSTKKDTWINSWQTAVQLHSTVAAIEATHNLSCDAVVVQGFYKGFEAYGKQSSPFCYSYRKQGQPPLTSDQFSYDYKAGWYKYPTWEMKGGVYAWIDGMSDEQLAEQFPSTAPIFIDRELVARFFAQVGIREADIRQARDAANRLELQRLEGTLADKDAVELTWFLDSYFPQRFDQCQPSFGSPCPYKRLCHGGQINPLENGFTFREPHHKDEADQLGIIHAES